VRGPTRTIDQTQREVWLRLAPIWAVAARESRDDGATPPEFHLLKSATNRAPRQAPEKRQPPWR
jgi:hypothetical protein